MRHTFFKAGLEGKNDLFSYVITIIIVILGVILANIPFAWVVLAAGTPQSVQQGKINFEQLGISESWGLTLLLLTFAVGLLFLLWMIRAIHKKNIYSVFSPSRKINWPKVLFSAGVWFGLAIVAELAAYLMKPELYSFSFDAAKFLPLLVVALLLLPLQTSFEEVMFRGYLMQGLGLATKNAWMPLLATSFLFGLLHYQNPEVQKYGDWLLSYYMLMGLAMGIFTVMDESLDIALGLHAANNIFGALIVTFPEAALPTSALFTISEYDIYMMIVFWFVMILIFWLVMAKKYNWTDYGKLIASINFSPNEEKVSDA